MSPARLLLPLASCALVASCLVDFDPFDPRLGTGGGTSQGGSAGSPTTSSSQGQGGGTSTTGPGGSGGSGVGGAGGSAGGAGGGGPVDVEYTAVIADCVSTTTPDPDACAAAQSANVFTVDGQDGLMNEIIHGYVRFDLDNQLAGKTVTNVTLRLTAGTNAGADSNMSGEIFEVAAFTRTDLFVATPTAAGMLAANQGAVTQGQVVDFTLPNTSVSANGSVYLGVFPTATNTNGVDYWNLLGTDPPKLVVTVQ